jgi:hypothetical protein
MTTSYRWVSKVALGLAAAIAASASASPVVYTLRTVADGKLGSHVFAEALVTIQMKADTSTVKKQPSPGPNGGFLYTNSAGTATVSVSDGSGRTTVATFAPGEVYVRYDAGTGVAGFGSSISPSYPIALDCDDYAYPSGSYTQDCVQGDWWDNYAYYNGTLSAMTDPTGSYFGFTQATLNLPQNLSQSTLLTGRAHFCATTYTIGTDYNDGNLQVCSGPAARGLRTDRGGFFLQDQIGGTTDYGWVGWAMSNVGSLQVEVMTEGD